MTRYGQDDWRARTAARASPMVHTLARAGWLICCTTGVVVTMVLAVLLAGSDPTTSTAASFAGWLLVLTPLGAVLGGWAGLVAQSAARNRLLGRAGVERRAVAATPDPGLRPHGRWARFYEACARSVATYHEVVATVAPGPGRDWLADIGRTLDAELAEALRLAWLGESLEPAEGTEPGETVYQVLGRLRSASRSFAETTERAAAIALDLRSHSDFVHVRAQLDMLAEQAPQLRRRNV